MSLSLSIDLNNATFADLRALVDAARTAGVQDSVKLDLEDTTLLVTADAAERDEVSSSAAGERPRPEPPRSPFGGQGSQIGDAAIRSVIDILTGRQEPPRRTE
ncbi:MAG: hypothetical protein Q4G50_03930 [Corynebacterium sp.]|uniref:hypothetical protein n=1 Tax=Corynebacterium sp. TaxID=1720 RepID=UPI0026E0EA0D|nr:hypothetical protein [Corynebacterium sp.]MDO5669132.1 hypothetical protein [Corynebacterium sp.]